jgi:hypothetical protein
VSRATKEKKPKDKRLVFMGLFGFCLACTLQAWCKVGARCGVWQVEKSAKFAHLWRGVSRFALSMSK